MNFIIFYPTEFSSELTLQVRDLLKTDHGMNCLTFLAKAPLCSQVKQLIKNFGSYVNNLHFASFTDFDKSVAKRIYMRLERFQDFFCGEETEMIFGTKADRGPIPKATLISFFKQRANIDIPIERTDEPIEQWNDEFEKELENEIVKFKRKHGLGGVVLESSFESDDDSDEVTDHKSKRKIL